MKSTVIGFVGALLIAGCATVPTQSDLPQLQELSSSTLWTKQATTSSPLELAMVEAELGSRGETSYGTWYLGQKTASAYGRKLYQRTTAGRPTADEKNCSDFGSSAEAQKYFLASGGPVSDPNRLDGDGDGLACDWGTQIATAKKRYASKPTATPRATSTYRSSSRCYVGPRGGRYTITSSGRKNYGGC
ncbi:MAG: excalibur calcium-binding domain-containing protein [Tabrizicola sp.]|nr:excalibur calcium-binding domain-containing protein [Tabrizicola sp.]